MNIWIVSMECAGLAEAGGVKNVAYSLCRSFSGLGNKVTLFIPVFACSCFDSVKNLMENRYEVQIQIGPKNEKVTYSTAEFKEFDASVVFINHPSFAEKHAVYVYTREEQFLNPGHQRGQGHVDMLFLDAVLSKSVAEYGKFIPADQIPHIIHCQDASTAVIPAYIAQKKDIYPETKTVVTIHNAGPSYHHEFCDINQAVYYTGLSQSKLNQAKNGNRVEPFLLAAADGFLTTVSDYYAEELVRPEFSNETDGLSGIFHERNIHITGITNGIDYDRYCPENPEVSLLPYEMNPLEGELDGKDRNRKFFLELCEKDRPYMDFSDRHLSYFSDVQRYGYLEKEKDSSDRPVYFMYHGRIVWQKGISILIPSIQKILSQREDVRFIVEGQGDISFESRLVKLSEEFPGKIVYFQGYNRGLSRLAAAAADFALFPSFFEPCGLEDFIAQIYGTVPLAHATGGLCKIINGETGFTYRNNTEEELFQNILKMIQLKEQDYETMKGIIMFAAAHVKNEYDWHTVAEKKYLKFFENLRFSY